MADIAQLDVTVDLTNINNTTPASSPASSSGSDSDVVNTASARVYFGPFQSPEKKLIRQIIQSDVSRRHALSLGDDGSSQQRSAPFLPVSASRDDTEANGNNSDDNDESDDDGEDVSHSRSGTPDNVRFPQDGT
jgi:hypothetical protein